MRGGFVFLRYGGPVERSRARGGGDVRLGCRDMLSSILRLQVAQMLGVPGGTSAGQSLRCDTDATQVAWLAPVWAWGVSPQNTRRKVGWHLPFGCEYALTSWDQVVPILACRDCYRRSPRGGFDEVSRGDLPRGGRVGACREGGAMPSACRSACRSHQALVRAGWWAFAVNDVERGCGADWWRVQGRGCP